MELGKIEDWNMEEGRVYLRLMTKEDTDDIIRWRNSEVVRKQFIYQKPFTRQGHEKWIETMIETGKVVQMMIVECETDKAIGSVYIRDIDMEHKKGEYGIFIGEEAYLGKGYGTEAAELMTEYAFYHIGLHKIMLRVYADNIRAIKSYEKAGFVKEAYLRDDVCILGKYRDIILMAKFCEENK